jgi:hypothetical protein
MHGSKDVTWLELNQSPSHGFYNYTKCLGESSVSGSSVVSVKFYYVLKMEN